MKIMKKQIIALGGGGLSMIPENLLLANYILAQPESEKPKICFLGTASGDADSYYERFMFHFTNKNCIPGRLSLFQQ
jgi:dipeptidase E